MLVGELLVMEAVDLAAVAPASVVVCGGLGRRAWVRLRGRATASSDDTAVQMRRARGVAARLVVVRGAAWRAAQTY